MMQALAMTRTGSDARREAAREIGDMWRRISRRHLTSGQGCACGFGGGLMLQGADFELDIVEFLIEDARKAGRPKIEPFIDRVAKRGPDTYSLSALIEAAGGERLDGLDEDEATFVIVALRKTLGSMDSAHSAGRFACD